MMGGSFYPASGGSWFVSPSGSGHDGIGAHDAPAHQPVDPGLRRQPAGIPGGGVEFLPELFMESPGADGARVPAEIGQGRARHPYGPALPPQPQGEIVVPGRGHVLSKVTCSLQSGTAEEHRRLGDVVEALDGEARGEREEGFLEPGDALADLLALFADDPAAAEAQRFSRPGGHREGNPIKGAGMVAVVRVQPGNEFPGCKAKPLVDGKGRPPVRFGDDPRDVPFMTMNDFQRAVSAAAVDDDVLQLHARLPLGKDASDGLLQEPLAVFVGRDDREFQRRFPGR